MAGKKHKRNKQSKMQSEDGPESLKTSLEKLGGPTIDERY